MADTSYDKVEYEMILNDLKVEDAETLKVNSRTHSTESSFDEYGMNQLIQVTSPISCLGCSDTYNKQRNAHSPASSDQCKLTRSIQVSTPMSCLGCMHNNKKRRRDSRLSSDDDDENKSSSRCCYKEKINKKHRRNCVHENENRYNNFENMISRKFDSMLSSMHDLKYTNIKLLSEVEELKSKVSTIQSFIMNGNCETDTSSRIRFTKLVKSVSIEDFDNFEENLCNHEYFDNYMNSLALLNMQKDSKSVANMLRSLANKDVYDMFTKTGDSTRRSYMKTKSAQLIFNAVNKSFQGVDPKSIGNWIGQYLTNIHRTKIKEIDFDVKVNNL